MHTTTPVEYEFTDDRKRKLEPPSVKTAPPVKLAHGPEGRRNTEEATCTNQMDNTQKNAWGPIFQNREHFVDLHVC